MLIVCYKYEYFLIKCMHNKFHLNSIFEINEYSTFYIYFFMLRIENYNTKSIKFNIFLNA